MTAMTLKVLHDCVSLKDFSFFFLSFSERSINIGLETATMPALIGDLHELERRFWSIEIVFFLLLELPSQTRN